MLGFGVAPALHDKELLLRQPAILEEIKPTRIQLDRIKGVQEERDRILQRLTAESQALLKDLAAAGDRDAVNAALEDDRATRRSLVEEFDAKLMRTLDDRQRARLSEIQLQIEGPMAFTRPELQQRLNLSAKPAEAIKGLVSQGRVAMYKPSMAPSENLPELSTASRQQIQEFKKSKCYQQEIAKIRRATLGARDETMQKILEVLSEEQRADYKRWLGAPFPFDKMWGEATSALPKDESGKPAGSIR